MPSIKVTEPEAPTAPAPGTDLRIHQARYAIYRRGMRCADVMEITEFSHDDSVGFLIGSRPTFQQALERASVAEFQAGVA